MGSAALTPFPRACFVAVDGGPREALRPLANAWGVVFASVAEKSCLDDGYWREHLSRSEVALLVTGSSESDVGRGVEFAARMAAASLSIPVAVVEDFPGNFRAVPGARTECLVVESQAAAELATRRLGADCPRLLVVSPARYDDLRLGSPVRRQSTAAVWAASPKSSPGASVLWVGQPEFDEALVCLKSVVPAVLSGGHTLLFRAHPRDAGWGAGVYREISTSLGARFRDVTELPVAEALALAPRLILTQYSSMMVDAGFYGIPTLCLLLPGAAGDNLFSKKGYRLPLPCQAGAVSFFDGTEPLGAILQSLLNDEGLRAEILGSFDTYFSAGTTTTERTVAELCATVRSNSCMCSLTSRI